MSDAKNTNTVEVPREVVERVLMALDQGNAFNCAADLRACIKPRRWEREEWFAIKDGWQFPYVAGKNYPGVFRCRIIWEEIL